MFFSNNSEGGVNIFQKGMLDYANSDSTLPSFTAFL